MNRRGWIAACVGMAAAAVTHGRSQENNAIVIDGITTSKVMTFNRSGPVVVKNCTFTGGQSGAS